MMPDKTFNHSAEQADRQLLQSNPRASETLSTAAQSQELQRELADLRITVEDLLLVRISSQIRQELPAQK